MKALLFATTLLAAIGTAGIAQAQNTAGTGADALGTTALVEAEDRTMLVGTLNMSVEQLSDVDIYTPDGDVVGEVDEVLMTPDGRVVAVTAEIGGFLGVGAREVVLPLDQVSLAGDRMVTTLTREQLEALDSWDD